MTEEARMGLKKHYRELRERERARAEADERRAEEYRLRRLHEELEAEERRLRMIMLSDCLACMFHGWCLEHSAWDRFRHAHWALWNEWSRLNRIMYNDYCSDECCKK